MALQAIETSFAGHRFRSRLEARWAVFLDTLRVPWKYETDGFELDGERYLPDFWLPGQKCWLEVKPREVETPGDLEHCRLLALHGGRPVFMLTDDLCPLQLPAGGSAKDTRGSHRGWHPPGYGYAAPLAHVHFLEGGCEWAVCPACGAAGIDHAGQHSLCGCHCAGGRTCLQQRRYLGLPRLAVYCYSCRACLDPVVWEIGRPTFPHRTRKDTRHPRLLAAYDAARQARFEHGETPAPPESEVLP